MNKQCIVCHKELFSKTYFCTECERKIIDLQCKERIVKQGYVVYILFFYVDAIKQLIHEMKFQDKRYLSKVFAHFIARFLEENKILCRAISFVPNHWLKHLVKGYDQMEDIAKFLSQEIGVPWYRLVQRKRFTKSLFRLSRKERYLETRGIFELKNEVRDMTIILDDIYTTGSTIESLYQAIPVEDDQILFLVLSKSWIKG